MKTRKMTKLVFASLASVFVASLAYSAGLATTEAELKVKAITDTTDATYYTYDATEAAELGLTDSREIVKYLLNDDGLLEAVVLTIYYDASETPARSSSVGTTYTYKENVIGGVEPDGQNGSYFGLAAVAASNNLNFTGDYFGNSTTGEGGVFRVTTSYLTVKGDFIGNSASYGGAFYNYNANKGTITLTGDFIGNNASVNGGAVYHGFNTMEIVDGSFIGNSSAGLGGAFFGAQGTQTYFTASTKDVYFTGNYMYTYTDAEDASTYEFTSNAIYIVPNDNQSSTVYLRAKDGLSLTMNDAIFVDDGYVGKASISINNASDYTGTVNINNSVTNSNITVSYGTLSLGTYAGGDVILNTFVTDSSTDSGYMEYTTSAAIASFTNMILSVGANATLSFVVTEADSTLNTISFTNSTLSLTSGATIAFDFSNLVDLSEEGTGVEFSLTIDFGDDGATSVEALYAALDSANIVFMEDIFSFTELTDNYGDYLLYDDNGSLLLDLSIDYEHAEDVFYTDNYITISGTSYFSTVPEPSTYAMIVGILALGFAYYRRRK